MLLPEHGANPDFLLRSLKINMGNERMADFSVNTNPFGPPKALFEHWEEYQKYVSLYPDPSSALLKEKIACINGVKPDEVLVGNGAAELIYLLSSYFQRKRVLIVEPTFSEYRKSSESYDCHIDSVLLTAQDDWQLDVLQIKEKIRTGRFAALFLCHPNNPTGRIYNRELLLEILNEAERFGVKVIVDEAFYDFCTKDITVVPYIANFSQLIVLRSLTKIFSIPGLRLGYAIMNEKLAKRIAKRQHPWNVNAIAQIAGLQLLKERSFICRSAEKISSERNRLFRQLAALGYDVSPSEVNYYLLKETNKEEDMLSFIKFLLKSGIVPRHTYNFAGLDGKYVRLAIKEKKENDKLLAVLKRWKDECCTL